MKNSLWKNFALVDLWKVEEHFAVKVVVKYFQNLECFNSNGQEHQQKPETSSYFYYVYNYISFQLR